MKYNFTSGAELLEKCKELNMTIHELCVEREAELTGISKEEVKDKMNKALVDVNKGLFIDKQDITFKELIENYISYNRWRS